MSTRSERDKSKAVQDKNQSILSGLLKDEDNKYCVDCDAKGPRWASWNLGVFLCIRCAGIHRNLGVHISKVKSVNLDSWTPEQLDMVQEMGNSRARAVYEANLPDNFRRPQTDSRSLEVFIRAKYEQKKYIAREWVPPKPKVQPVEEKKEKKKSRPRPAPNVSIGSRSTETNSSTSRPEPKVAPQPAPEPPKKETASVDLLGLETPQSADNSDPFGDFLGVTDTTVTESASSLQNDTCTPQPSSDASQEASLFGDSVESGVEKKSTKESILALYGSSNTQQQQMYGVPGGMYMANQQQNYVAANPQQNYVAGAAQPMMGGVQNGMMGNNMMQTNMGMVGMSANQQMQQPNMVVGQMGGAGQMVSGQPHQAMMATPNMYSTPSMYSVQQQQQQLQQVQNQMASMKVENPGMGGFQQPVAMATAGGGGWDTQATGSTLSNNLWQ